MGTALEGPKGAESREQETAVAPAVRSTMPQEVSSRQDTATGTLSKTEPGSTGAPLPAPEPDSGITAGAINLKPVVDRMFARELFKLEPSSAGPYFAPIAALQPQPSEESWQQTFGGSSSLPWVDEVLVELHDVDGRWLLGRAQITWRPPTGQASALYARLVAEIQATRKRKPTFGRDESEGRTLQQHVGWTWCKGSCEAMVSLDSTGQASPTRRSSTDKNRPVVQLTVLSPEGS